MIRCTLSALARSASVDPFTNTISLIDIAENLGIEGLQIPDASEQTPAMIAPFGWVFAVFLSRQSSDIPEEFTGRLMIVSPGGREFPGPSQPIDLVTAANARSLTMIPTFPFTTNGLYRLQYQLQKQGKWELASELLVPVTVSKREENTEARSK